MDQQTRDALQRILEAQQALSGEIGVLIQHLMDGEEGTAAAGKEMGAGAPLADADPAAARPVPSGPWMVSEAGEDMDVPPVITSPSDSAVLDSAQATAARTTPEAASAPDDRPVQAQAFQAACPPPADPSRSALPHPPPKELRQRMLPADLLEGSRWKVAYMVETGRQYVTGVYPSSPPSAPAQRPNHAPAPLQTRNAGEPAARTQARKPDPAPKERPSPAPEPLREDREEAEKEKKPDFEWRLGLSWINKIGVGLLLLLGLAFAAKFSYDHMSDGMRTALPFLLGAAVLWAGELLNRKFPGGPFALGITGGGVAILYLGAAVGYFYTERLSPPIALLIVVAVTALAFFLSLRHNAQTIAAFALVGGYLPLFVLRHMPPALVNGAYAYFLLLTAFALLIARKRRWKAIPFLAFLLNLPCMFYLNAISDGTSISLAYTALSFAMLLGMILYAPLRGEGEEAGRLPAPDMALLLLASVAYTAALVYLVAAEPSLTDFRGLAALIMAGVYLGLSFAAVRVASEEKTLIWLFRSGAFAFSLAVIPMQFGYQWLPLAWNGECLALALYARRKQSLPLAVYAKALLVIASAVGAVRMAFGLFPLLVLGNPWTFQHWLDIGSWVALLFAVLFLYRRAYADPLNADSTAVTAPRAEDASPGESATAAGSAPPRDVTAFTPAQWALYVAFTLLAGWLFLLMATLDVGARLAFSPWMSYWPMARVLLLLAYPVAMRRWKSLRHSPHGFVPQADPTGEKKEDAAEAHAGIKYAHYGRSERDRDSQRRTAARNSPAFTLSLVLSALMLAQGLVVTAGAEMAAPANLPPMALMLGAFGLLLFAACGELALAWYKGGARPSRTALIFAASAYDALWGCLYLFRAFDMGFSHVAYSLLFLVLAVGWILLGFRLREKTLRYGGLALTMAALFKLFVIDLHWLTEWRRVLSYIVFGLLLIGISYLYQLYAKKLHGEPGADAENDDGPPPEA